MLAPNLEEAIDAGYPNFQELHPRDVAIGVASASGGLLCASLIGHGKARTSLSDHIGGTIKEFTAASICAGIGWGVSYVVRYQRWNTGFQDLADMAKATQLEYDNLPLTESGDDAVEL